MKMDDFAPWEAFLGVAQQGSFSKASRLLRVPVAQVSKRVSRLESQLNVRLFQRTTRVVSLTDEGKLLLPRIQSILEDLKEAESFFESRYELAGTIRVTAVPFVAHRLLVPVLKDFSALHPGVHIELDVSERFMNLVDAGYDMALRVETPKDSNLVYRKLVPNDLIFCAAPAYLKKNQAPLRTPGDLHRHDLLMLGIHRRCHFKEKEISLAEFEKRRRITCENGAFLTELALEGFGILVRSIWDARPHLVSGRLTQVLKNHPLETFGYLHAVIPSKRYLAPRVRAFLDFVVERSRAWVSN